MANNKLLQILIYCGLPLSAGGLVYLLLRPNYTYSFAALQTNAPAWIIYSLPDGLWAFSLVSFVLILWGKPNMWYFLAVSGGIVPEILQLPGIIRGTFDPMDLTIQVLFMATASIKLVNFKTKQVYEKSNS